MKQWQDKVELKNQNIFRVKNSKINRKRKPASCMVTVT
jgi:hypothetical protein